MKWAALYRVAVVILLALILAQMAGLLDLRHDSAAAWRRLTSAPRPEEEPAPGGGGLGAAYEDETIRALMQNPPASEPAK